MHLALSKLTALPDDTLVLCGHEYTLSNMAFALSIEPGNRDLQAALEDAKAARAKGQPTVPSTIGREKAINPFLRTHVPEVAAGAGLDGCDNPVEVMRQLRAMKDVY